MVAAIDLDHLALAFERAWDGFDRYAGDLGGRFLGGGPDPGFWWHQLQFANGVKVELLEPRAIEEGDFLRRFLDRNGPGPHHLTFKVPDIHAAIDRATSAGYPPVRVNLDWDGWKEAFLHPKVSHGIVVQLAQYSGEGRAPIEGLPEPRTHARASLDRIVHLVADLDAARKLWEGVLDGEVEGGGAGPLGEQVDLVWPSGGRIRLVAPEGPAADWMGTRPGRLHHLAFTTAAHIDRARVDDGVVIVAAENNHGVRLHLRIQPPGAPA